MNLRAAQRFLSDRKTFLQVTGKIDGHEWVTDRFVAVRRDQLPESFTITPVIHPTLTDATKGIRFRIRQARDTIGGPAQCRTSGEETILFAGPLMVAVDARRFAGMPGVPHLTRTGIVGGFLPDRKGTPRLVAILMPVMPHRVFPHTAGGTQ